MTDLVFGAALVRAVDWTFTLLALAGVLICLYTALDAWLDLRARTLAGLNGTLLTAGRIACRGAVASAGLHTGFLVIGATAVTAPLPPARTYQRAILVGSIFVAVQLGVVVAQVRNQLDRSSLRRPVGEETHA